MIKIQITESTKQTLINELNNLPIYKGIKSVTYESIKDYENILKQFPNGTIIGED